MNVTEISRSENVVKHKKITLKVDKFIVKESYTDDVLISQFWSVDGGFSTTHPTAYCPDTLHFNYYENNNFLNSNRCCNSQDFYMSIPESSFIYDWSTFKGFDHVLCDWLNMDGNIYRIDQPEPIPLWRKKSYIGGYCNDKYDIDELSTKLSKLDWIRNVSIKEIDYFNKDPDRTHYVYFEYKLPSEKCLYEKVKELIC